MGIPIGKMALYTALGGIPPQHCLPILLDVGTDNEALLKSPIYIGWQQHRVRGPEYDDFIEAFVNAVHRRWPHILLQWESSPARMHYGSWTVIATGYARSTTTSRGRRRSPPVPCLPRSMQRDSAARPADRDVRLGIGGGGNHRAADCRDEQGLTEAEARQRIYAFNRHGLIVEGDPGLRASQVPLARKKEEVAGWKISASGPISLRDTVEHGRITVLVGVSAQAGAFTEEMVRIMARNTPHPVIFPLSNPTSVSEAKPEDLFRWTDSKAIVGTGSPFAPVDVNGHPVRISQINNSFIFPGWRWASWWRGPHG